MPKIFLLCMLCLQFLIPNGLLSTTTSQENDPNACLYESNYPFCNDGNVLNGYWWSKEGKEFWVPYYSSVRSWFLPAFVEEPVLMQGNATFYAPWVMEGTAEVRGLSLEGYKDGIALMSPADIGSTVWIYAKGYGWYGPLLVVDCATHGDIYPLVFYGQEVAEFGAKTALELGMVSETGKVLKWEMEDVLVTKLNPFTVGNTQPVDYKTWWLNNFTAGTYKDLYTPVYRSPCTWRINDIWKTLCSLGSSENSYR